MSLTTKDLEQALNFKRCLGLDVKIGLKGSGKSTEKKYYHVQFGDTIFYKYLESIGLSPAKSKIIGAIDIPDKYFFDFLRGSFDGDGTFYSYWDPRWRSSHMFYLEFVSASKNHIFWLRKLLNEKTGVIGHINMNGQGSTLQLKYAKKEALEIIKKMYYNPKVVCLTRKRSKVKKALIMESRQQKKYARVEELVDSQP